MSANLKDLLFEIGTEELPSGEIDSALQQLADHISAQANEARLAIGTIETYTTPRRLAVIVRDVAPRATDMESLVLGPSAKIAFDDDGNPTRAAIGFAKGKGLDADALQRVETPKGTYVGVTVHDKGRNAEELLPQILESAFRAIHWKRSMHWGWADVPFARPVRWIVALLGEDVLPVTFGDISSDRFTRGHRFLAPDPIALANVDAYLPTLRNAYVMASLDERKTKIREGVAQVAKEAGFTALIDEDLVQEVAHLNEWPTPMLGRFDEELLDVPREVLIVSMRTHQRYFPAETADGKLANVFIFVSNMIVEAPEVIVAGNLRVLRARLEDARFFWDEDRKITLEERRERLAAIRYIDGLGSVRDRSDRLEALTGILVDEYGQGNAELRAHATRAARLCKSDLASAMIFEFGELQGIMGRYYALADGEPEQVAIAIDEHYMPRSATDQTPQTEAGVYVALANKIDAIVGCFALGLKPSGSADPYALRRAAIGLLRILSEKDLRLRTRDIIAKSYDLHPQGKLLPREDVIRDVDEFIRHRIPALLPDTPTDIAQAVIAAIGDDIPSAQDRADVLMELQKNADFEALAAGFKRVVNIVAKAASEQDALAAALRDNALRVDASLLKEDAEIKLHQALQFAAPKLDEASATHTFDAMARTLIELKAPIDAFFDDVLVNDDNPKIRENRLALLASLREAFLGFADISLVQAREQDAS